ncbi:MAG: PTS sugar transporter subunit IIB [Chloroflexaceae bacterium]|nr:PTS sugar transporter subunit IIB [Chloroflexaceae bacterium]
MSKIRIMVVCGFGLGSSMVLKLKLDAVLKQHGLKADTFCADVMTAPSERYDLVFTSRELLATFQGDTRPVVAIGNFLSEQEIAEKGLLIIQQLLAHQAS